MAVTITVAELAEANRIGSTTRETSEVSRLRDYAIATISQHLGTTYDDTPEVVVNLAAAQLVGYLYDKPTVSGGVVLANAFKFSGAGQALFPYRIHHVGLVGGDLVRAAQASVGTEGNPVTDVTIIAGELVVTFADGSTETHTLPAGDSAVVDAPDGRLPGAPVEMRIAWSDGGPLTADQFTVAAGATVGTTAATENPDALPPPLYTIPYPIDDFYNLGFWFAGPTITALMRNPSLPVDWTGYYTDPPVALEVEGVAGVMVWTEPVKVINYLGGVAWFAVLPGSLIATQTWVTARIADIMLSGGGITEAQAQALIDTAVADFETATEIEAVVTAAIAALPEYQTLAQVNTLITTAIDALMLGGQTATEVQAAIDAHAAMPNIHHTPGRPQPIAGSWRFTYQTPMQSGLVYYANAEPAGELDTWIFTGGSNTVGRAQLTDLAIGEILRIEQSNAATRYQTITLSLAPEVNGVNITIYGTADRVGQFEIPGALSDVTVSVSPQVPVGVDQEARDSAEAAQSEIDTHELSTHNTDTTARTDLAAHEATPHGGGSGSAASWHWVGSVTAGLWQAGVSRAAALQTFPIGGYGDYDALRDGLTSGAIAQVAIYMQQIDVGGADGDEVILITPNITGFTQVNGAQFNVYPPWGLGVDPNRLQATFGVAGLTMVSEVEIAAASSLIMRVGVWA